MQRCLGAFHEGHVAHQCSKLLIVLWCFQAGCEGNFGPCTIAYNISVIMKVDVTVQMLINTGWRKLRQRLDSKMCQLLLKLAFMLLDLTYRSKCTETREKKGGQLEEIIESVFLVCIFNVRLVNPSA